MRIKRLSDTYQKITSYNKSLYKGSYKNAHKDWHHDSHKSKRWFVCLLCLVTVLAMGGCQAADASGATGGSNTGSEADADNGAITGNGTNADSKADIADTDTQTKPVIICTLFPQYDFARQIYGDEADVRMLLAPGQESHMYDPTPQDMIEISNADMFIYTGDEMEPWAAQIVESLDGVKVLDLSKYVDLESEEEHEANEINDTEADGHSDAGDEVDVHGASEEYTHDNADTHDDDADTHDDTHAGHHHHNHEHSYDPHFWLNLDNAAKMAEAIADASAELPVTDREALADRAKDYVTQLHAMDEKYKTMIADSSRTDIVFAGRFAYGYLISHYGLTYETVYQSCSAEADPSIYDMTRVIDYINEHQVHTIFYEELSSGRVAQTIFQDTGASMKVLSTAHNVSKEDFDNGITFLDIMQRNYDVLKEALN